MTENQPTYKPDNIFAKILDGEMAAEILFENDICVGIMDVFPQSRGHALVIPRAPSRNLLDADIADVQKSLPYVQALAIASKKALSADGIRIAQFNEPAAGQTVFHLHWHIIPVYENAPLEAHAATMADPDKLRETAALIIAHLS